MPPPGDHPYVAEYEPRTVKQRRCQNLRSRTMITKWLKMGVLGVVGVGLVGGVLFGRDALSYAKSVAKSFRTAVKDTVPIEFELKRASDLLDEIIPEMHANIR